MTLEALAAAAMAALLTHGAASGAASAADIKVIRAGGIGPVATALAGEFERASGHKRIFTFVSAPWCSAKSTRARASTSRSPSPTRSRD